MKNTIEDYTNENGNRIVEDDQITVEIKSIGVYAEMADGTQHVIDESHDLSWWSTASADQVINAALAAGPQDQ